MSIEPTHFLTVMNNGVTFSSLHGMTCSYQSATRTLTSQGIGFFETLKTPANLFKNNLNNTRNNMKPQIQKKKKKKERKNGGIVENTEQNY